MKAVTRIHTCIIHRSVIDYIVKHGGCPIPSTGGMAERRIEFMQLPPPERLVKAETVEVARPLPDGSLFTRIKVTALEDEA